MRPIENHVTENDSTSKPMQWTGYFLSGLAVAFMLMDGVMKLLRPSFVVETSAQLGYASSTLPGIGAAVLICTALYIVPRTSMLGAILLTGFLGGAVASKVRVGAGPFDVLFPVAFAALLWGGLWLRDGRLRKLLPLAVQTSNAVSDKELRGDLVANH